MQCSFLNIMFAIVYNVHFAQKYRFKRSFDCKKTNEYKLTIVFFLLFYYYYKEG